MALSHNIGFIGAGNMASAIIGGLLRDGTAPDKLRASDPDETRRENQRRYDVLALDDNAAVAQWAQVLVLAVKPQQLDTVLSELSAHVADTLVVSIAAGVRIDRIESALTQGTRVVRTMPNTPAMIRKGVTAIAPGTHATEDDLQTVRTLFEAVGQVITVTEPDLDAVTGLSGSGPAYVFRMIDALANAGRAQGLAEEHSLLLAVLTVEGAVELFLKDGHTLTELIERVSSPGGTTVAGLKALSDAGFDEALHDAVAAATTRSKELS